MTKDSVLAALGLKISDCRGQAYDGAANMSGRFTGLGQRILEENSKALHIYCAGHNLNLVLQDIIIEDGVFEKALEILNGVVRYIRKSPKRLSSFTNVKHDESTLRPLAPTRRVMRAPALDILLRNYDSLLSWLEEMQTDRSNTSKAKLKAQDHLRNLELFTTYFCLRVLQKIFGTAHSVHEKIQTRSFTVGEVRKAVDTLVSIYLCEYSSKEKIMHFYEEVRISASSLMIDIPSLPRKMLRNRKNIVAEVSE